MKRRSAYSVIVSVLIASGVSACGSLSTDPVPSLTEPVSSYGTHCEDLVGQETLASSLDDDVQPVSVFAFGQTAYPLDGAVQSVGGLNCAWSNGLASGIWNGPSDPGAHAAQVVVVPDAADRYPSTSALEDPNTIGPWPHSSWDCSLAGAGHCTVNALVGSSWVFVTLVGLGGGEKPVSIDGLQELAKPFVDDVIRSIASDGNAARIQSAPSSGSLKVPSSCTDWIKPTTADSVFDISDLGYSQTGGTSPWDVAATDLGAPDCILELPEQQGAIAGWTALPGGSWAFSQLRSIAESDRGRTIDDVDIAGLPAGSAFTECFAEPGPFCALNVSVDGDWVSIVVNQQTGEIGPTTERDVRASAAALASIVVGEIAK